MKNGLITEKFTFGTFDRRTYAGTLVQKKLRAREFCISKAKARCVFRDALADRMRERGAISENLYRAYLDAAEQMIFNSDLLETNTNETVLRTLTDFRKRFFNYHTMFDNLRDLHEAKPAFDGNVTGIDDSDVLAALRAEKSGVLYYISDRRYLKFALSELEKDREAGKTVAAICTSNDYTLSMGSELGPVQLLTVLNPKTCMDFSLVDTDAVPGFSAETFYLRGFGEDALMASHDLSLPAVVDVTPEGMPERAVTNLLAETLPCRIYVPAGFSIVPFVPFVRPTVLTYYHLSYLRKKHGEKVYKMTVEALRKLEPGLFFSIYEDGFPITPEPDFSFAVGDFYAARTSAVLEKCTGKNGVRLIHTCLEKERFTEVPIDYSVTEKQNQVVVDGFLAGPGTPVRMIADLKEPVSPREYFRSRTEETKMLLTNFSFFFTDKLRSDYNRIRRDREKEQLSGNPGYVDYYRYRDADGVLHETLPLYGKHLIAYGEKSGYRAFSWKLQGGALMLSGERFRWEAADVNPKEAPASHEICLYTPLVSTAFEDADKMTYAFETPADRMNVAIINETVVAAREGGMLLPPIGFVLSLSGAEAERLRKLLGTPDAEGYYAVSSQDALLTEIRPDKPACLDEETWNGFEWIFGGILNLMSKEDCITEENAEAWIRPGGWMSPLSRQTQESAVHEFSLHPRTAIGVTSDSEFFVLVFSGRTLVSAGVNYAEMCRITKKLIPNAEILLNVDGGGSSVLALISGNRLTEISLCAPSDTSLTGQVRPVSSMVTVEL